MPSEEQNARDMLRKMMELHQTMRDTGGDQRCNVAGRGEPGLAERRMR